MLIHIFLLSSFPFFYLIYCSYEKPHTANLEEVIYMEFEPTPEEEAAEAAANAAQQEAEQADSGGPTVVEEEPTATVEEEVADVVPEKTQHDYAFIYKQHVMSDLISRLQKFEDRILCLSWMPYFFDSSLNTEAMGFILSSNAFNNIKQLLNTTLTQLRNDNPEWVPGEVGHHAVGDKITCSVHGMLDVLYVLDQRISVFTTILGKRKNPE